MSSKTYFDSVARDWDNMRKGFFPDSVRDLALKGIPMEEGLRIGDIGAGSGFITEGLWRYPVRIFAIDQSKEMLNHMRSKFKQTTRIEYVLSDSENIPLADESLDYAIANMYLHHVERPKESIAELFRILAQGGKLIITDLESHHFEFLKTEHCDRWMGFDREDIRRWFEEAGFAGIKIDCANADCCSESQTSDERAEIGIFLASGVK